MTAALLHVVGEVSGPAPTSSRGTDIVGGSIVRANVGTDSVGVAGYMSPPDGCPPEKPSILFKAVLWEGPGERSKRVQMLSPQ